MAYRIAVATAFTAASLFASVAYAGSPYYDANGQMPTRPAARGYAAPAAAPSESEAFDHAVGTDGSSVASAEAAADPKPAPVYSAAMPKMDADGFEHAESDKSFYEHAVGTDGSQVVSEAAPAAPKAQPVYSAAMPKMDANGYVVPETGSSFYNHAVGTDGSP